MKKSNAIKISITALSLLLLSGCSQKTEDAATQPQPDPIISIIPETETEKEEVILSPVIEERNWSHYFEGMNGAAVIYDPAENYYQIYNQELALTKQSPCSTFKIISSTIALEHNLITPDHSMRTWSGEVFWNEKWNKDISFDEAFPASCVWYFRELIDEIGKELMTTELEKLQYGNQDISDWEGRLNTNNQNRALTGFWIESSLKISPKEQVEVMERIFGHESQYSKETIRQLKQVMLYLESPIPGLSIYGKTGMGKAQGVVVDAWYTGFSDSGDKRMYFCIYLGETDGAAVSSTKAKEIAVNLISDLE